jgi:hypothetical protein
VTYNCLWVRWNSHAQLNQVTTRFVRRTWANIACWELYSGCSEKNSEVLNADTHLPFQFQLKAKLKVKLFLLTPWKNAGRTEVWLRSFLTSTLERGEWTTSRPGCFIPGKDRGTHWTAGWVDPRGVLCGLWRRDLFRLRNSNPGPTNPQRSHYNHYATPAPFSFNHVLITINVKKKKNYFGRDFIQCSSMYFWNKNADDKQASQWRSPILKEAMEGWKFEV